MGEIIAIKGDKVFVFETIAEAANELELDPIEVSYAIIEGGRDNVRGWKFYWA